MLAQDAGRESLQVEVQRTCDIFASVALLHIRANASSDYSNKVRRLVCRIIPSESGGIAQQQLRLCTRRQQTCFGKSPNVAAIALERRIGVSPRIEMRWEIAEDLRGK